MSHWDIVRDNFEDDHSRAFMLACPWSQQPAQFPVTGRIAYSPFQQQRHSRPLPKGGSGKLTEALARFIEAHNGVILTSKPVTRLIIESGKCAGVECGDGSSYRATKAVLSTIHIKHLVDMAPRELWGEEFIDGVETWQPECQMFAQTMRQPSRRHIPCRAARCRRFILSCLAAPNGRCASPMTMPLAK